jgi:hypothetical protein
MSARVPESFARAEILDGDGRPHPVAELWAQGPALLLFVRHFG